MVTVAEYDRYESRLLEVGLAEMTDVKTCPRLTCQMPVIIEKNSDMGSCPACFYVWCIYCDRAWHGTNPCRIKDLAKVMQDYEEASEEERGAMERRYGYKKLQSLLNDAKDMEYLRANSVPCPNCKAWISKIDGCNKMYISRCIGMPQCRMG